MPIGWLVNDRLSCIVGVRTFWNDLLECIPGLIDKTNGHTKFMALADRIENEASTGGMPDYIIRNATFFRRMNLPCKQISLLQDCYTDGARPQQVEVCNNSAVTVFNSNYTFENYRNEITECRREIIPLGTDFQLFRPVSQKSTFQRQLGILPNSLLFVGSSDFNPKGFNVILDLINSTGYNFCLVMKDSFNMQHARVRVFNKVPHETMVKIYNSCDLLLCTSTVETLHLAGIEAAACDVPLLATNVGAYFNRPPGEWGMVSDVNEFIPNIKHMLSNCDKFSPRQYFLKEGFDKMDGMNKWKKLVESL